MIILIRSELAHTCCYAKRAQERCPWHAARLLKSVQQNPGPQKRCPVWAWVTNIVVDGVLGVAGK